MKIALTGVSSFTGCHIAKSLVEAGHEVKALLTRSRDAYVQDDLISTRLRYTGLKADALVYESPFGADSFLGSLRHFKPDVLVNHGAEIKGYRSPDFDVAQSVRTSLERHEEVVRTLAKVGGVGLLHSGTVFEPIDSLEAISPYGQSKFLVSQALQNTCAEHGVAFSKIYIANPIGPYENPDRLIPVFVRQWLLGQVPHLSAPRVVWDHVPAPWLARIYCEESQRMVASGSGASCRPSGFQIDLEALINLFVTRAKARGVRLPLEYSVGENSLAPVPRLNSNPCVELKSASAVDAFFDEWVDSLFDEGHRA